MKKIHIILLALTVCFASTVKAQYYLEALEKMDKVDFKTFVEHVEKYYENKDKGRGSGYKQFKRWEYYHAPRLNSIGYIYNVAKKNWEEYYDYERENAQFKEASRGFSGNWKSFGPAVYERFGAGYNGGNGRVNCIAVDPSNSNIIYAGTPGGGLWKTTNGGSTWLPMNDFFPSVLGVSGIAIDPKSPANKRTIYILTGDGDGGNTASNGVLKSTDNGKNWNTTGLEWKVTENVRGYKLVMHPSNNKMVIAATNSGIYKSTDAALTWKQQISGGFVDIEFNTENANTMYASTSNGKIYISKDAGSTWTAVTSGLPSTSQRVALGVTAANSNYVYALYGGVPADGKFTGLYRSTNGGSSFTKMSDTPNILGYETNGSGTANQSWYDLALTVSPANANEVHAGGINCWKSTNGGSSWTNTSYWYEKGAGAGNYTHADIHALEYIDNTIYCGSDGGIFISTNKANDWKDISKGLEITQFYRIGSNPNKPEIILGGAQDNGSNRVVEKDKKTYHWYGADGFECIADPVNINTLYGSYQNGGLLKTTNNGVNVSNITPSGAGNGNWLTPFVQSKKDNKTLYAGYADLFKSTNSGSSWTNISNAKIGSGKCDHIALAPSDENCIYVSKNNRIYKTTNGGSNWTNVSSGLPSLKISYFVVHPKDKNKIWVTVMGYNKGDKVYKSVNGGSSWTNISYNLPNLPVNCIEYLNNSNDRVYIGMDIGVYYHEGSSTKWVEFSKNLPKVEIFELEMNYVNNKLRAGTFGRGIWETDINDGCPEELVFTAAQSGTQEHRAKSIISSSKISDNAKISYLATNSIKLKSNFSTGKNVSFKAKISNDACDLVASSLKIADDEPNRYGYYAGPMPGLASKIQNIEENSFSQLDKEIENIKIYPNPATSSATIEFHATRVAPVTIEIRDIHGQSHKEIVRTELSEGKYEINFDVSDLKPGIYMIRFHNGRTVQTEKLIINN